MKLNHRTPLHSELLETCSLLLLPRYSLSTQDKRPVHVVLAQVLILIW